MNCASKCPSAWAAKAKWSRRSTWRALEKLAGEIKKLGVESVAIFFMNSYINPAHEEAAAEKLRELLPDIYVTCSTELTREWYEYERSSTVGGQRLRRAAGEHLHSPLG